MQTFFSAISVKRVVLVLFGLVLVLATSLVIAIENHLLDRSRPIALQPTLTLPVSSASEYVWTDTSTSSAREWLSTVDEYLKQLPPHARVIDVGCGNGSFLANFRGRGWTLVGVDFSESGIKIARSHWPDIRFDIVDATADLGVIGYGSFDAVISTDVVEHVFLPRKYAMNCFKLLKPGGTLVISTPYHGYLKNLSIALSNTWDRHVNPLWDYGHIKFWSVNTLSRLLFEAGFDQLEWKGTGRFPYLWKEIILKARVPQRGAPWKAN